MSVNIIQTARLEMAYRLSGEGFPVVFLHGWPESSLCWDSVVERMTFAGKFLRPDLRGMGDSTRKGAIADFAKKQLANDVLSLLDSLNIAKCAVVGHDWGGVVAQEMTFLAPERFVHQTLLNTYLINSPAGLKRGHEACTAAPFNWMWYQSIQQIPGLVEELVTGRERAWLKAFFPNWPAAFQPVFEEYVRAHEIPGTIRACANYYRSLPIDLQNFASTFGRKQPVPTQLIWGVLDPVLVPEYLFDYEKAFHKVELEKLQASHFVPELQPFEVAGIISKAISKASGGVRGEAR